MHIYIYESKSFIHYTYMHASESLACMIYIYTYTYYAHPSYTNNHDHEKFGMLSRNLNKHKTLRMETLRTLDWHERGVAD